MVINKLQNGLKVVGVKAPIIQGREYLEDIAIFTGGTMLSQELGHRLDRCDPVYVMGKADKVQITKDQTIIIRGQGKLDTIKARMNLLDD